jgi:ubiquinone/menaquinone biosynthesis C-methylase UbiE
MPAFDIEGKDLTMSDAAKVIEHYGKSDLKVKLEAALAAAGLADRPLSPADLAPLDQFHTRGMAATIELAEASGVKPGQSVVDIGSGLGGPSRYLAARYGCTVHGVDLSPAFVEAATYLAERAGLSGKVTYDCADALALPYEDERFDLAWTQHVAMNIADRLRLYREIRRVLKPGGRFVAYDVVVGDRGPVHYPVPWSRTPETSFLVTPDAMRDALEQAGFKVVAWDDRTKAAVDWFTEQQKARAAAPAGMPASPPPLGLHVAMGADFPTLSANLGRNLREGRVAILQAVLDRPLSSHESVRRE